MFTFVHNFLTMHRKSERKFEKNSSKPNKRSNFKSKPFKKKEKPVLVKKDDSIRLNKFLSNAGICSRRDADNLITAGLVTINGEVVNELGSKVMPDDDVRYNGERIRSERKVYILMNKPKDYITTLEDPHAKKIVTELFRNRVKERVYPVGRLDRNTTGVLLFTNDGDLSSRLTHPGFNKKKIYSVDLDKAVTKHDMVQLSDGIELDDGSIQVDAISYTDPENKKQVGVEIHSGRNRIVRRMFEHLGYRVIKLDRVYFAGLTKKSLRRGQWRYLNEKEIGMLKMNAFE
jgi:23S rRNA pseudouridine2605 synthase